MYNKADDLANNARIRNASEKEPKQVKKKTSPPTGMNIRAEITEKQEGTKKVEYRCPKCSVLLGTIVRTKDIELSRTTVLASGQYPRFCPFCGKGLRKEKKGGKK